MRRRRPLASPCSALASALLATLVPGRRCRRELVPAGNDLVPELRPAAHATRATRYAIGQSGGFWPRTGDRRGMSASPLERIAPALAGLTGRERAPAAEAAIAGRAS